MQARERFGLFLTKAEIETLVQVLSDHMYNMETVEQEESEDYKEVERLHDLMKYFVKDAQ